MLTFAMIHTVSWYQRSVIEPFASDWLRQNPDVQAINIVDDSLLTESLAHGGPNEAVIRRIGLYVDAAVLAGADVVMCSCTTMGLATEQARQRCPVPVFNIDEPMAAEAVRRGSRFGILATFRTSAPATRRLLEREAAALGKAITTETVINEDASAALLRGEIAEHNRIVHAEMDALAQRVDVIVLGQISLAQIQHRPGVPVLQVGHSGFAHARRLLDRVAAARAPSGPSPSAPAC